MRFSLLIAAILIVSIGYRALLYPPPPASAQTRPSSTSAIASAAATRLDAPPAPLDPMAQLGQQMFFDPDLSGSGKLSCASCHNPHHAYASANALPAQLGGRDMKQQGARVVPTLTYLERTPRFVIGLDTTPDPDDRRPAKAARPVAGSSPDTRAGLINYLSAAKIGQVVPEGGMDWDGRAAVLSDQAEGPLFDPREMANRNGQELLAKLRKAPYANQLVAVFGPKAISSPDIAMANLYLALARFQTEDRSFHAYNSKFDYYLAGRAQLNEQELRGRALFDDSKKGNCAACHLDKPSKNRFAPVFTDYQFEALAAPRNKGLIANRNPAFFDEGLCGPVRKDMAAQQSYCGMFKTPTLRNVATRQVFFHNGAFHSLEDVVRFYVERETRPERWYPHKAGGMVEMYDDLPPTHRKNVDVSDAPFDRHRGDEPALNNQEIKDVVAFLKTLTDGYGGSAENTAPH